MAWQSWRSTGSRSTPASASFMWVLLATVLHAGNRQTSGLVGDFGR